MRSIRPTWTPLAWLLLAAANIAAADELPRDVRAASVHHVNPLPIAIEGGRMQTSCADPTIVQGRGDPFWYAICTSDSLADDDVGPDGVRREHLLPMLRSEDLVHWTYMGDAFATRPAWVAQSAGLWAPELVFRDGQYFLYYAATDTVDAISGEPDCRGDSAVGVAVSASPLGPFRDAGGPVVAPRRAGPGCSFFHSYDPEVLLREQGEALLYYGSYYGGIEARVLSADGLSSELESATPITIPNRYEGAEVVEHEGYFYLFASASNCCNGPLTGYQVFAGRAEDPLGPFLDREGASFLSARVGGTPVLTLNGNRWIGTGHNSVFRDAMGDHYAAYHAVDRDDPFYEGAVGYTRRPLLMDRITWDHGWPEVRRGLGASATPQLAPMARVPSDMRGLLTGARTLTQAWLDATDPSVHLLWLDALEVRALPLLGAASDDFAASRLSPAWTWVRPPDAAGASVENGVLRFATQAAELYANSNDASVLTRPAPSGNYVVEVKVEVDLPETGCCQNYVQAALLIYGGDDAYLKLAHVSIWETRQTEFAKEVPAPPPGYPAYGSGVGGPTAQTTWLRIAKVTRKGEDHYVSYTSRDGLTFTRGAVWTHALGPAPKLGLVAMGGRGFTARFDYVRTYALPL